MFHHFVKIEEIIHKKSNYHGIICHIIDNFPTFANR